MKSKYLVAIIIILTVNIFAQSEKNKLDSSKIINSENVSKTGLSESEAYKLLYENSKETNGSIVTTIHWVLGITIAFLLALFGSQVFFNYRINRKEIDNIKNELGEKLNAMKLENLKEISGVNQENIKYIQTALDSYKSEINGIIEARFTEKSQLFNALNDITKNEIESFKKSTREKNRVFEIDIEKNSGDIWRLKNVEANALTSYIRTANLELKAKREIKYILKDITEVLEKMEDIYEGDYEELDNLIKIILPNNKDEIQKIEELYKTKPVYKFIDEPGVTYGRKWVYVRNK
jgi:hypothetical protein